MDVVDGKIVSAGSDRSSETWCTSTSAVTATSSNSSICDPSICELADESIIATPEAASRNYIIGTSAPPGWATSSWRMTPTAGGQVSSCGEYYFNSHPASSFMAPTCLSNCKMQVAGRHLPLASGMMSTNVPPTALLDVANLNDNRWGVATPAGTFIVEGPAARGGDEYNSNPHHNYNSNFFQSAGAQHHPRLNPNRFLPPLPLPGQGDGGIRSGSGVGHGDYHQQHADAHVMDHGMATMRRMIPCDSGASLRAPNVQTHIPMRGGGCDGGRVVGEDLASVATQLHHHRIKRPHGYRRLYHLHQRRHHQQHQHHHQQEQHRHHQHQQHPQQAQQCQAVDHQPPNPGTVFDQEMRMFESQIAQTASRNIKRQPPPLSPSLLPVQAAHVAAFAERFVPSPPLSLADHEDYDDDLPLQGASKPGGASRCRGVNEILQGEGSNVQQGVRIMSSSSISKSAGDHLPSMSQLSTQIEAEAAVVVPAPLENVGPVGGSFGSGSASAGNKVATPLSSFCELSEMICSSSSSLSQQQQQQPPPCGLPSPGSSHSHKRKISEPIEDEVSTWIEPLRFLVRKGLTLSDCGELGRVVLPKKDAEAQLPWIDSKEGALLTMTDYETMKQWLFRYKWWLNNKSRMYVLENTGEFIKYHELKENDAMLLYKDASGKLVVHGEKNLNSEPSHAPHQQSCSSQSPHREM